MTKRTKYHWYHMRLLRNVWKPIIKARIQELDWLSDLLGDDHDLAVFRQTLLKQPSTFGSPEDIERLMGLMQHRRRQLQGDAYRLGRRIFAERPGHLVRLLEAYWTVWQDD